MKKAEIAARVFEMMDAVALRELTGKPVKITIADGAVAHARHADACHGSKQ
jgi:hypothetical protein